MGTNAGHGFSLTDAARAALEQLFSQAGRPSLRVFLSFMDESGPRLDLAPDAPQATDTHFADGNWRFIMNTLLFEQAAPVTVDVAPEGFCIHSALDFSEAGGNCGGHCDAH